MLSGRNRRLLHEWRTLEEGLEGRSDITCRVLTTNAEGLPTAYLVNYSVRSISGVTNVEHLNESGVSNEPVYDDHFTMQVTLPANYPQVDGAPVFHFLTLDENGHDIPHRFTDRIRLPYYAPSVASGKRRSSELVTTLTLERAMHAELSSGGSMPNAASGTKIRL